LQQCKIESIQLTARVGILERDLEIANEKIREMVHIEDKASKLHRNEKNALEMTYKASIKEFKEMVDELNLELAEYKAEFESRTVKSSRSDQFYSNEIVRLERKLAIQIDAYTTLDDEFTSYKEQSEKSLIENARQIKTLHVSLDHSKKELDNLNAYFNSLPKEVVSNPKRFSGDEMGEDEEDDELRSIFNDDKYRSEFDDDAAFLLPNADITKRGSFVKKAFGKYGERSGEKEEEDDEEEEEEEEGRSISHFSASGIRSFINKRSEGEAKKSHNLQLLKLQTFCESQLESSPQFLGLKYGLILSLQCMKYALTEEKNLRNYISSCCVESSEIVSREQQRALSLEISISTLNVSRKALQSSFEAQAHKMTKLEETNIAHKRECQEFQNKIFDIESKLEVKQNKVSLLEIEMSSIKVQLEKVRNDCEDYKYENGELSNKCTLLQDQLNDADADIDDLELELSRLRQDFEIVEAERDSLVKTFVDVGINLNM